MKNVTLMKKIGLILAALCGNVTALCAAEAVQEDNGDLFIWIFLAFCALVIIAQLVPAIMMLTGFAKGVKKEKEPAAKEPLDHLSSPEV